MILVKKYSVKIRCSKVAKLNYKSLNKKLIKVKYVSTINMVPVNMALHAILNILLLTAKKT